jgi:probable HAF family extracellular repeat protein
VSADGSTVVGEANTIVGSAISLAFRWTSTNGMENLGSLPGAIRGSGGQAYGVSADGSVVVGYAVGMSVVGTEAFRWTEGTGMIGLGNLSVGSTNNAAARSISSDGSIIVGYSDIGNSNEAVRWENGIMTGLNAGFGSAAYDTSADGSVIVGQSPNGGAFRWENDAVKYLGHLPGGTDSTLSRANAVSSNGLVVVGTSSITNETYGDKEAFRWENDVMTGLGDLPGGDFYSWANDVSGDGSMVVGYSITQGRWSIDWVKEAFIWDQENGMRNLKTLLINEYGLNLNGWILNEATGISNNGQTIVGFGINPSGVTEAWIVTIPEPCTLFLLALGGMILKKKQSPQGN